MTDLPPNSIAIIGMACRFPGAPDVATFWRNLLDGVESVTRFAPDELEDSFPAAVRAGPDYVAARPILDGVEQFDAGFFGMLAREAALTDPQQRIFLEIAWEALEDAGYDPAAYAGAIGVFAGASMNTYFLQQVCRDRATIEEFTSTFQVGGYPVLVGNGDFIATRTAYKLDLRGPALSMQTACSTSLVAVAQACQSLLLYQSDMALAGGASISFPQRRGYLHQEGGMVAADGHCRTFDARASGTVFGSGAGVVLLKRLEDALADGDQVHAVIRGAAVNNDGAGKVGFTAPSIDGQAAVIAAAQAMAGVDPRSISYIECHGTATPLGDPIEVAALTRAFRAGTDDAGFCALGSVKTNIGHLDAAAGVAGLIKTALALKHGRLPATLHFKTPNPRLELDGSPFRVQAQAADWPAAGGPRRAGVSALGVGGTNAHAVLEEAPAPAASDAARPVQLLVLSARSPAALARAQARLAAHLRAHPEQALADVAFTLQLGRRAFPHRIAFAATDHAAAIARLEAPAPVTARARDTTPPVAFLFPGQGAQYPDMGRALYDTEPAFRQAIDDCAALLLAELGQDLRALLYPATPSAAAAEALRATAIAQPAIFAVEYALAQVWMGWGVRPAAMAGHSVGEFVAACLAGTMALADALALVAARGRLMQTVPPGAMLAVRLPEDQLRPLLPAEVSLAAVNAPALCVAAGPFAAIAALEAALEARGANARRLHTSHAFHSAMVEPILPELAARVARIALHAPAIPFVSGVSGTWITEAEATDPGYWARHCRAPVRFADALATLVAEGGPVLLEVGPSRALATFAAQGAGRGMTIAGSLPDAGRMPGDLETMLDGLGRLWTAGVAPDWRVLHAPFARRRVTLPTYPFERERCWIDAPARDVMAPIPLTLPSPPTRGRGDSIAAPTDETQMNQIAPYPAAADARQAALLRQIVALLEQLSGEELAAADPASSFLELGFDSLFLGQFAQALQAKLGLKVAFRQLLGELPSIAALAAHAAAVLPPEAAALPPPAAMSVPAPPLAAPAGGTMEAVMREQLAAMQTLIDRQLAALRGTDAASPAPAITPATALAPVAAAAPDSVPVPEAPSRFTVYRPGAQAGGNELTPAQRRHIQALTEALSARTAGSKRFTQDHRPVLADPRAASGFRAEWKELVYPIVSARSKGARIWDLDGHDYIDLVNGYGQTAFGHAPDFVVDAVAAQLHEGFAIGPQSPLAGEVAALVCALTGNERVTFCNTGSEAVMAALRIARAVTGRERVVVFSGAYHGQFDEVLVKGVRSGPPRALPVAPGIPAGAVQNMVVLPYGTPESLEWVRAHAGELAAVVVEPVQSRHPALLPEAFLRDLRAITAASGTAYVFDEVVTGFRLHNGGMQALLGIRADMATYGKVAGGGMPVGILAGQARFMDALDGGQWQYGDDSYPSVPPTFFAGTFVRHPLVLAATRAVLLHLQANGETLRAAMDALTATLVGRLDATLQRFGLLTRIETRGSLFYFSMAKDGPLAGLLWPHMRLRGVNMQEGFPCFLTTAHGEAEIAHIAAAFEDSLQAMLADGVLIASAPPVIDGWTEAPPTEPQTEIWLTAQLGDAASCAFNESITLRLDGALDPAALAAALNDVLGRHDALRCVFSPTGESLRVAPAFDLALAVEDADEAALAALLQQDAATPFDLVHGPLLRTRLLRLGAERHALVFTAHHAVCDGWSMNVILGELANRYAARRGAAAPALAAPLQFSTYARQQAAQPDAAAEAYWLDRFRAPPPPLELPTDRPRPARKSFRGATHRDGIDAALTAAVRRAGARQGCTLFATLLGAFQLLLGRLADTADVVVGIPAAGQSQVGDQVLVGHCVQFLPLRAQWDAGTRLPALLKSVRQTVLDAYDRQNFTLGTLVRKLDLPREAGRVPLVEVQFNLERLADRIDFPGLHAEVAPNPKRCVNFDLFLNMIESEHGLRIDLDYSTDLFDAATMARWMGHFRTLLAAIAAEPDQEVHRLPLLSAAERQTMLVDWNATAAPHPEPQTVDALIAAQAARTPEAVAARCGDSALLYRELLAGADALARRLRREVAGTEARIGILLPRSLDMLVAMLATWRAGFAYVPLDPTHPPARLALILGEADVAAVITDGAAVPGSLPLGTAVVRLGDAGASVADIATPLPPAQPDRTAYVIYTSGSTGRPKGVEVGHGAVVNLLASMARAPGLGAGDRLLAVTTIAFDIAALELFLPLSVGAELVIADAEEAADGFALLARLRQARPTAMQATPTLWRILLEAGFESAAGMTLLCGGEALDRALADRLLAGGGALWNMYGPTETTIWSATEAVDGDSAISIGRPIANTRFYILDRQDEPVPVGAAGELCIAGDGLARGYFGRPDLTAAAFARVASVEDRVYRTGDLARFLPDGRVQVLGRRDSQVKLRGFRIELGEIEAALGRLDGITAAAVTLLRQDQGARLIAYTVARPGAADDPAVLMRALAAVLPDYMVPGLWVRLDAMPMTPNGKIDRRALPPPDPAAMRPASLPEAPRSELEAKLAAIWQEVLGIERIGIRDDLFALGADSIHLFRITARMLRDGIGLSARQVVEHPTIAALAAVAPAVAVPDAVPSLAEFARLRRARLSA